MAILSLIFSFIGRKIGDIVQAIFGWSITALFGKLAGKRSLAVTVALVLSLAWPVFVVGLFFPAVAGWVLALVPLESWVGPTVLRVVWASLAVLAPPIVGLLVHFAAPDTKGSAVRSAIAGYPLALGFFISFLVTAITVPIVKVFSFVRGWSDTHVYVQPRPQRYDAVLRELAEACARAGVLAEIVSPPKRMMIATNVLRTLAKSAVSPIVAEDLKMLRAKDLELTLYPSDLLLRGNAKKVAQVRAMMTRTEIDADAYLVGSPEAQEIQDELGRLLEVLQEHEARGQHAGAMATSRLTSIWHEMNEAKLEFDEWVMLEAIARRVERRIATEHEGAAPMPLDGEEDGLAEIAAKANAIPGTKPASPSSKMKTMEPPPERLAMEEASTVDLFKEALDEAKELVRLEVQLAKTELDAELAQAKKAAFGFALAAAFGVLTACMLAMALVLALGGTPITALLVAGGFTLVAAIGVVIGYSLLPKNPLAQTRHRLDSDFKQLKEHLA